MAIFIPVDITSYYRPQSLVIEDEINTRSTARFQMADKTGALEITDGAPIEIYDYSGNLIFGGYTIYPRKVNPIGTDAIFYDIECVDMNSLADRYLVAMAYTNETSGNIVRSIMNEYLLQDGVTEGTIETGATIEVAKFTRTGSATDAINQIAEINGFHWYIDFDKKLYFQSRTATTAPFNIADNSAIVNINVRKNRSRYRNRQYFRGGVYPTDSAITGEAPSPKPDGVARTFTLRYPVAEKPRIYVNSVEVSQNEIGVNGLDGSVTAIKWFYSYNSATITQDSSQTVLSTTDTITVDYIGLIPLFVVVEDTTAIDSRAVIENNAGIYESLETDTTINNKQQALDIAYGRLRKYTKIESELEYETYTNGLFAGQIQTVTLSKYGVSADEYLIDRVTLRDYDDNGKFVYEVHAVDGEAFGGWTEFFKQIALKNNGFSINPDEALLILKSFVEIETWSESQAYTIFACTLPNTTVYPSSTFYPC